MCVWDLTTGTSTHPLVDLSFVAVPFSPTSAASSACASKEKIMYFIQSLSAGHTPSGNPKRVYVVYDKVGMVVGVFDEGYNGIDAVPEKFRTWTTISLPVVKVPHSEYKFWLKRGKAIRERV